MQNAPLYRILYEKYSFDVKIVVLQKIFRFLFGGFCKKHYFCNRNIFVSHQKNDNSNLSNKQKQMVNPYVSVDCVILGFDGAQLNVLLVRQSGEDGKDSTGAYKLPGSLINMDEDLDEAAQRVLKQLTGLAQVKMTQFRAFGGANRLANTEDAVWLQRFHKLNKQLERIVTIAYLSLLRIDRKVGKLQGGYEAQWVPLNSMPHLAFDHEDIVRTAVEEVKRMARLNPTVLFDLLPRKFTAAQLRLVMEHVVGIKPDVKNFHKKLAQMPYVVPLDEKEEGVSHRAARYYKFKKVKQTKTKPNAKGR